MQNLITNRHSIYTYRKQINGSDIRVSLQTKDKLEAIRITNELNTYIGFSNITDPEQIRRIIFAVLIKLQPKFKAERLSRLHDMLGVSLDIDKGEPLSVIISKYVNEKLRSNSWTEKTYESYKSVFATLPLLIGDKGVKAITNKDAQKVKSIIQRLPSGIHKRPAYRGKTIEQILKMKIPDSHLMAIKTVNTRLGCYSELMKWAITNGYAENNVFHGLVIKDTRQAKDLRLPFTPDDLTRIFSAPEILNPSKSWHYWIPVLGLYTGARLNELCQLTVSDIKVEQGINYIEITDQGDNQHLKSASSRRKIPIHSKLVELGFLDYVSSIMIEGEQRLFKLTMRNKRFSHIPSNWFQRIKKRQLYNDERKTFHSFRHTFIDYAFNKLKMQGNQLLKALVGHADKEITSGVYGSSFELVDLNDIIQLFDFEAEGVRL